MIRKYLDYKNYGTSQKVTFENKPALFKKRVPNSMILQIIDSQNHRMAWVITDLKDHQVQLPLTWAGTPPIRPRPYPNWLSTLPALGQPVRVSHHTQEFLPNI